MKKSATCRTFKIAVILLLASVPFLLINSCQKDEFFIPEKVNLKEASITTGTYLTNFAGPAQFSPMKGKMQTQTQVLTNANYEDFEDIVVVRIKNGDDYSENCVSWANVTINGNPVLTTDDFGKGNPSKKPKNFSKLISNPGGTITIDVEVKGGTSDYITIWLEGGLKATLVTGTFTDTRDGHVYKTVTIGDQVWLAENLAWLPSVNVLNDNSIDEPRYYVYGYSGTDLNVAKASATYSDYGVLYNWTAAQSASPSGWHLPSNEEWTELKDYLMGIGYNFFVPEYPYDNSIAKSMAEKTLWQSNTTEGTPGWIPQLNNRSGFSALPSGLKDYYTFLYAELLGMWWSSTLGEETIYRAQINCNEFYFMLNDFPFYNGSVDNRWLGLSVRCVKD